MESVSVPQHLELEDVIAWGLSATDLLFVAAGVAMAWWLYLVVPGAFALRVMVSAPLGLIGLSLGMLRLGDLAIRNWLVIAATFGARPRVLVTRGRA